MSEDDLIHDYPRTLGDCWDIFKRNGILFNHVGDSLFPNARKILELENKAKGNIKNVTVSELVSELRKRDGVDSYDVSVDSDSRIILYRRGTEFIDTGTEKGAAIILRITD